MTYFFWLSTVGGVLSVVRVLYYQLKFAEQMRRFHPERYRELMGVWEGPVFTLTGHLMVSGALLGFLWGSQENLGDSRVIYLREHHRRAVRHCLAFVAAVFLVFFALAVAQSS